MTSNAINTASAAADIIAPLAEALSTSKLKQESNADFAARINQSTLTAYAHTVVVVGTMMSQGVWTTGKQKKGVVSASSGLKVAMEAEAKANKIAPAKVKRLIEKAAAVLSGKAKLDGIEDAVESGVPAVLDVFKGAEIEKEADLIRHVEGEPEKDPVGAVLKKIGKFDDEQRAEFLKLLRSQEGVEITESAAAPGKKEKAEAEKAEVEKLKAKLAKGPPRKKSKTEDVEATEPQVTPIPKKKDKAKADAQASVEADPFS